MKRLEVQVISEITLFLEIQISDDDAQLFKEVQEVAFSVPVDRYMGSPEHDKYLDAGEAIHQKYLHPAIASIEELIETHPTVRVVGIRSHDVQDIGVE
jgi:hypothetical protein